MLFRSTCLWLFSVDNPLRVATEALNIHLVSCILKPVSASAAPGPSAPALSWLSHMSESSNKTQSKRILSLSDRQRQRLLQWLPIKSKILFSTHKMTYRVINNKIPEDLSLLMPINNKSLQIKDKMKLDTKPAWLASSKMTRATYRGRAYLYNALPHYLTTEKYYKKFKTNLKRFYLDKYEWNILSLESPLEMNPWNNYIIRNIHWKVNLRIHLRRMNLKSSELFCPKKSILEIFQETSDS